MACCSASGIVAVVAVVAIVAIYELGLPPFGDFQTEFPGGAQLTILGSCHAALA